MAAALRRIPTILHEHANLTDTPWFQKVADRLLEPYTDIAIAVSKSTADFVIRARQVPASKVKVVYLGVPLEEFSRSRSADEIAARTARSSASGRTSSRSARSRGSTSRKATPTWSTRRHGSSRERPAARFFLVGEGPLLPDLQAQAARLGLGDRFVFAGFRRDVARTLSAFDLSVFPSLWEGTPITAFEALAMGKPIVATDADGLLDILTDGHDAVIVPKRDAGALAEKIVWAIDHPGRAGAPRRRGARRPAASTTSARSSARWSGSTRSSTTRRARPGARACCARICRS